MSELTNECYTVICPVICHTSITKKRQLLALRILTNFYSVQNEIDESTLICNGFCAQFEMRTDKWDIFNHQMNHKLQVNIILWSFDVVHCTIYYYITYTMQ